MVKSKITNREIHTPTDLVRKGPGRCLQWTLAYGFLLLFFIFSVYAALNACGNGWTSRAKGTLRSTGSSQLAYYSSTDGHHYGTFQELQDAMYISEGYDLGNIIEMYSVSWTVSNVSTVVSEEFPFGVMSTFTLIAYPSPQKKRCLATFAITEDQVVRVYNPRGGNDLYDIKSWDPIL